MKKKSHPLFVNSNKKKEIGKSAATWKSRSKLENESGLSQTEYLKLKKISTQFESENKILRNEIKLLKSEFETKVNEEKKLREDLTILRTLIDVLPDAIHVKDKKLKKIFTNKTDLENIGKDENQVIGKTDIEVYPKEIAAGFLADDKQVIRGKSIINREEYLENKKGQSRWLLTSKIPLKDDKGKIIGLAGIGRDISERKQSEKILQMSEVRFSKVFHANPAATVISRISDGKIIDVNDSCLQLLGFKREEIINHSVTELHVYANENDRKEIITQLKEKGAVTNFETTFLTKKGEKRQGIISLVPIQLNDEECALSIVVDVTMLKQIENKLRANEERLSTTLNSIGDAVISTDSTGKVVQMNPVAENYCGWKYNEAVGKPLHKIFRIVNEITRKPVKDPVSLVLKSGKTVGLANHTVLISRDGTERQISDSAAPIIGKDGKVRGVVLVFSDVTAKKQAEENLRESEIRYRTISRLSSDFSYSCIHREESGYVVDWISDAFYTITGYDEEELKQRKCWMFTIHRDDAGWVMKKLNELQEGEISEDEFRIVSIEGRVHWVYQWMECVRDESVPGKKRVYGAVQNISDQKKAEELLKESEEKYRLIAENSFDLIYIMSFDGDFTYISSACERLIGYKPSELIGKSFFGLVDEKSLEKVLHLFESTKYKLNPSFQVEAKKKDGTKIVLEINSHVNFRNGIPLNLQGYARDITEKKRAEEEKEITIKLFAIINAQNSFRKMIEEIAFSIKGWACCDGIGIRLKDNNDFPYFVTNGFPESFVEKERYLCFKNSKGEMSFNADGKPLLQCLCGSIINSSIDVSLPCYTPNGSFWTNQSSAILNELTVNENIFSIRGRCIREEYESIALIPLKTGDSIFGLIQLNAKATKMFTIEKITLFENLANKISVALAHKKAQEELKENELKYRTLFETMLQGVLYLDADGKIVSANSSAQRILGLSYDEIVGRFSADERWRTIKEDMSPFPSEEHPAIVALRTGREINNTVMGIYNPDDNKHHWINLNAVPQFKNDELFPSQVFVTFEDITRNKNTSQKMADSLKEKEILLKEIHHRVKNNFQVVNSLLSLQVDAIKDKSLIGVFKESQNRIRTMSLIHELMYKSGNFTSVDVKDYIESLIRYLKYSYISGQINIRFDLDIDDVNLDMDTIISCGLLLNEIISNSIKHAFPENSNGVIGICLKEISNWEYEFRVYDNGIGIPGDQNIENLKTLGMQLISTLVKQINGEMNISCPGVGTEYKITFRKEQSI